MSAIYFTDLAQMLSAFPSTLSQLSLEDVHRFLRFARRLKTEIQLTMTPAANLNDPPMFLQQYLHDFLRDTMGFDNRMTVECWSALKDLAWLDGDSKLSVEEAAIFQEYGRKGTRVLEHLSDTMFYPPTLQCKNCYRRLGQSSRFPVVYFSKSCGSRPAYSTSLMCSTCKIRYYPNYYVENRVRCYYGGVPDVIHFESHAFIDAELCEQFTQYMLLAWVSGQNCANIYNEAFAESGIDKPSHWPQTFRLSSEQAWRAFFLNALLRDWHERGKCMTMSDDGTQNERLQAAMEERNRRMVVVGQPEKLHACSVCEKIIKKSGPLDPNPAHPSENLRSLRAVVTDGISIGHPCCAVHNCTTPLGSNRDRFCPSHRDLASQCVVTDCTNLAEGTHRTCSDPDHRALENHRNEQSKAFFQLQQRLKKANVPVFPGMTTLSDADDAEVDDILDMAEEENVGKSDEGNRKVKARFGRRRTHNEQLVVTCCGVIAARATMFGAEAISGVKDFLKSVYNFNFNDLPSVIFYDNNCHLMAHLLAQGDDFFMYCILPVDVFHFKSKHKESDEFCQKHCNPAMWPELSDDKGNWVFNSSAAEQANVWMGGYLAIAREMLAYRFDFFFDEMIKRRNERVVAKLRATGKAPYRIPPASP